MESLTAIEELDSLILRISEADEIIRSPECEKRQKAAREAYARKVGFFGAFAFGYEATKSAAALPIREEIYRRLPDTIEISPAIAFFMAADFQSFSAALGIASEKYDSANSSNFKGMVVNVALGALKPEKMLGLVPKLLKSWKIMFDNLGDIDQAESQRNRIARAILSVYQLTETSTGIYVLKRGKWGLDSIYGQYTSNHYPKMTENEVEPKFDFRKLKERVQ